MRIDEQRILAVSLVDKYVRFRHLPKDEQPHGVRVLAAHGTMIELEGWTGYFAPHLFVVVKRPGRCRIPLVAERRQAQ